MSFSFRPAILALVCLLADNSCTRTSSKPIWTEFSGEKALEHVQKLVDLGPRPPGSDAIVRARAYIEEQLESSGWKVVEQAFSDQTPRGEMKFVNLIATFGASAKPSFILCSHYDTKIFDSFTFVGANDGGSSTGLLLEMARVLALEPRLAQKIELVFFDGEEAVENFSDTDGIYGSRHFAQDLGRTGLVKAFRGGLLFDMVGDRSLDITLPPNSPSKIAAAIFASADALKLRNNFTYFDQDVTDDHTPLNAVGIPVVDLIDFHYPPWHSADDTMDKLSGQSLQIVGSVTAYYLSELAFK
jgi:Zn-dependent M28 family amino/carboxypeptidase